MNRMRYIVAGLFLLLAGLLVFQRQQQARLRGENEDLQHQLAQAKETIQQPKSPQVSAAELENGSNRRLVVRNWARGGSRVSADRKGRQGIGKPDQAKHTMYRGWPHPRNPRYSGFRGVFGVCRLRLQRLGSSLEFGTGMRMAPNTSFPG